MPQENAAEEEDENAEKDLWARVTFLHYMRSPRIDFKAKNARLMWLTVQSGAARTALGVSLALCLVQANCRDRYFVADWREVHSVQQINKNDKISRFRYDKLRIRLSARQ